MANLNKVILIGNLTRDPEVRFTPKGTAVTDLGLAVNRTYATDQGERREEVTYIDATIWGKPAELAGKYLRKGRMVCIEGRLHLSTWDDKQTGQKRSKLSVIGENLQFLDSRGTETPGPLASSTAARSSGTVSNTQAAGQAEKEPPDNIPF